MIIVFCNRSMDTHAVIHPSTPELRAYLLLIAVSPSRFTEREYGNCHSVISLRSMNVWFVCRFHVGPLYVLGSIVAVVFINLGTRLPGEQSAYSVFNEGIRSLPGQLDADSIDDQMRRGQM